ncbi:MAG: NADH-quinone oxidoreductase subunit N [Acidimicrobiia bacterium]
MENIAFLPIGPEVILLGAALVVLMVAVTTDLGPRMWGEVAFTGLVLATLLSWVQWSRVDDIGPQLNYGGLRGSTSMVVTDHFTAFAGIVVFLVAAFGLLAAWPLVESLGRRGAEFIALVLLSTVGLHTMAMANNLLLLFIGLEAASISLYVIAGVVREQSNSDEAAMKYFLLGSFASAIFLYGIALTFAATGSTSIYGGGIEDFVSSGLFDLVLNGREGVLAAGIALLVVGLGFKVSAAPFHQWAPDVYQGAAGGAVGFMAAGVKVAGFAAIARILVGAFPAAADLWAPPLSAVAALSVVLGTVFAISQTDIKRMLAYSGVAHAGFMLTALVGARAGVPAMWFYLATYAFQLLGAFTVTAVVSGSRAGRSSLDEYQGLGMRLPVLAGIMAVLMLSMAGIPFTAGFVGKVSVFAAAADAGYTWLVVVGLVTAVAGLFFYLRVIVRMYFQQPVLAEGPGTATAGPEATVQQRAVLGMAIAVTIAFGLVPWPLLNLVQYALPL